MGELDVSVEASLGQLAVVRGVISEPARQRLGKDLLECARAGKPRSLARLLLQGGFTAQAVQELLQQGAHLVAVRCDACGLSTPQKQLRKREELPCARCGSLILGFQAYTRDPNQESSDGLDDTTKMTPGQAAGPGPDERTESWKNVMTPPRESAETDRWKNVLPLPEKGAPARTPAGGTGRAPRAVAPVDDAGNSTLMFDRVLPQPGDGTVKLFPPDVKTPGAPPQKPFEDSGPISSEEVDRTITFGDVFLLPGRSAPRSDAEVTMEMNTLLAPPGALPLPLPRPTPAPPPARPQPTPQHGVRTTARAQAGGTPPAGVPRAPGRSPPVQPPPAMSMPGSITPPDFDPGGVTAPMSMQEIQAALAHGPPSAKPATPAGGIPASSSDVELTMTPNYAKPPSEGSDDQPRAVVPQGGGGDKKRSTTRKRREQRPGSKLPWLLAILAVLAGAAAVAVWWLKRTGRL